MIRTMLAPLFGGASMLLFATAAHADHGAAGTGPATAGPIVGTSATTIGKGKAAVSVEAAIAEPDNRSDGELAALAGRHIHAHDQDSGQVYTLSAAYGLSEDITLSASLPYLRRLAIREGTHSHAGGAVTNSVEQRGSSAGFGDASLVAKWRFTGENHHGWEAAVLGGLKVPTGSTDQIDDLGERFETEHQPGTGSWDPLAGIALTRHLPRGSFNFSAIYQFSTSGSQNTTLGDRAQATIGFAHRLAGGEIDYHAHDHHDESDSAHHQDKGATLDGVLEVHAEWEGREREDGVIDRESGGKAIFLAPGVRLNTSAWSFTLGASVPLAQNIRLSHSDTSYRLRFGVSRIF